MSWAHVLQERNLLCADAVATANDPIFEELIMCLSDAEYFAVCSWLVGVMHPVSTSRMTAEAALHGISQL